MPAYDPSKSRKEFTADLPTGTSVSKRNKVASNRGAALNMAVNKIISANPNMTMKDAISQLVQIAQSKMGRNPKPTSTPTNPNKPVAGPPAMPVPTPSTTATPSRNAPTSTPFPFVMPTATPTPTATPNKKFHRAVRDMTWTRR